MNTYNINISKLCELCGLGILLSEPAPINGGFLHRMYDVKTDKGHYAVKALNPNIMTREKAVLNYKLSEIVANKVSEKINVSCANKYNNSHLQNIDGQYYLIYDYINGQTIGTDEITAGHSYKIGRILAIIHGMDFSEISFNSDNEENSLAVDFEYYLTEGKNVSAVWYELLKNHQKKLYILTEKMNSALTESFSQKIISHCDLDFKNIMWNNSEPIVIDWECAGYIAKNRDFLDTSLYWSLDSNENFRKEHFKAFINGYQSITSVDKFSVEAVLYSSLEGKISWLEYNLKRSLGIECADENERKLGTEQVIYAIGQIERYVQTFDEITACFNEVI